MNVVVDEQVAESANGVPVRNLIAGFHTAEIRKSPAVDDLISSAFVGQVVKILQKMNPQHQFQVVGLISALSLVVARSHQLLQLSHGMIRSICSRNSLLCVWTSFNSSLKNDRFICLFIPLFYHFFVNFSTSSSLCGVALSKSSYETLKKVNLEEMGESVILNDADMIIKTENLRLLLIILNEEITASGLEEGQNAVNSYGRRLYELYDELIAQK